MPMDLIVCLGLRAGVVNLPLNLTEYARVLHNCTSVRSTPFVVQVWIVFKILCKFLKRKRRERERDREKDRGEEGE